MVRGILGRMSILTASARTPWWRFRPAFWILEITNTSSSSLTLTVQNAGGGTLAGTATVSAPFQIISGGGYSLGPNQSQNVVLRFNPATTGSVSKTLTCSGGGGATITLSAVGPRNSLG